MIWAPTCWLKIYTSITSRPVTYTNIHEPATSICHFGQPKRWNILDNASYLAVACLCFQLEGKKGKKNENPWKPSHLGLTKNILKRKLEFDGALADCQVLELQVEWIETPYPPYPPRQPANLSYPRHELLQRLQTCYNNQKEKKWSKEIITKSALVCQIYPKHLDSHVTWEVFWPEFTSVRPYNTSPTPWLSSLTKKLWLVNLTPLTPYHPQKYVRETNGFPDSISPRHFWGQFDVANSFSSSIFGTLKDVLFSVRSVQRGQPRGEKVFLDSVVECWTNTVEKYEVKNGSSPLGRGENKQTFHLVLLRHCD